MLYLKFEELEVDVENWFRGNLKLMERPIDVVLNEWAKIVYYRNLRWRKKIQWKFDAKEFWSLRTSVKLRVDVWDNENDIPNKDSTNGWK